GATVAYAGAQKLRPDAGVGAHATRNFFNIGSGGFADVGDNVDKRNFGGKEGIGGVLDDLGGLGGSPEEGRRVVLTAGTRHGIGRTVVAAGGEREVDFAK